MRQDKAKHQLTTTTPSLAPKFYISTSVIHIHTIMLGVQQPTAPVDHINAQLDGQYYTSTSHSVQHMIFLPLTCDHVSEAVQKPTAPVDHADAQSGAQVVHQRHTHFHPPTHLLTLSHWHIAWFKDHLESLWFIDLIVFFKHYIIIINFYKIILLTLVTRWFHLLFYHHVFLLRHNLRRYY